MKYNYTIIIPHKNTPDLLQKCLDSIPDREDVYTIVVDDNSDPSKVDFEHFPGVNKYNTTVIFDKSGKGAGNARNVALDHIEDTRWLVFSDADDYFTDYLSTAFDKYKDDDADEIYFKRHSVLVGTDKPAGRHQRANNRLDKVVASQDYEYLLFKDLAPVCKFIKYELIKKNNIRFDAVRYSNDVMFFLQFALVAKIVKADMNTIYVVTEGEGSLSYTFNKEAIVCRYNVARRITELEQRNGYGKYHPNLFVFCYKFIHHDNWLAVVYFFKALFGTPLRYLPSDILACIKSL